MLARSAKEKHNVIAHKDEAHRRIFGTTILPDPGRPLAKLYFNHHFAASNALDNDI